MAEAERFGQVPCPDSPVADDASGRPGEQTALVGSAYEGAKRIGRLGEWDAPVTPPNVEIIPNKPILDARGRDMARNDGGVSGAVNLARDTVAGQQYLLNAKPATRLLFGKDDETWETEFQEEVEHTFTLWAESPTHWADASRHGTLTDLVRLAIGSFMVSGEVLASAEWMPDDGRPYRTAVLMLDPDRLSTPNYAMFHPTIEGGVERDRYGAPVAYHILDRHPGDYRPTFGRPSLYWRRVMARKPNWGRPNILHIFDRHRADQARGLSVLVAALREMKMLQQFRQVELQRAIVAATYAATLESDLPSGDVWAAIGGEGNNPAVNYAVTMAEHQKAFHDASRALRMDGVKIPTLLPGTHLKVQTPGSASPLGADYEASLQRHLASAFGISYEEFSRDFSKTNYSSGRAAMGLTDRRLAAVKKSVADAQANFVYRLWFEEAINRGTLETMKGRALPSFYEGLNSEAYTEAAWIGAGRGQVDEMKETQAAMLRLRGGLSTLEAETARLGGDYRRNIKQRAREQKLFEAHDMPSPYETETTDAENAASGEPREVKE